MTWIVAIPLLLLGSLLVYVLLAGPKLPPGTNAVIEDVLKGELPEIITGRTGIASSSGVDIWYECISPEGAPEGNVLLLTGMGGDALFWPPAFIRAFVHAGYRTIRYDHRGTGMSDWVNDWDRRQPYTLADMASDALAVLDTLPVSQAHLVGLSMGGMIAQEIAIAEPGRVASLTLMMTSGYISDPDLPSLSSRYLFSSAMRGLPLLRYRIVGGEKNLIKEHIAKLIANSGYEGLDIRETAQIVLYHLRRRRGINLRGARQHLTAVTHSGSRYEKLKAVDVPVLIVHGTADPLIPIDHGRKLVALMSNATGMWLEGVGHTFPVPDMVGLVANILYNFENATQPS
jgi:pimeloyl-ACP methyl ester carboxylesterase